MVVVWTCCNCVAFATVLHLQAIIGVVYGSYIFYSFYIYVSTVGAGVLPWFLVGCRVRCGGWSGVKS